MLRDKIMLFVFDNYKLIETIVTRSTAKRNSYCDFKDICQDVFISCCESIERNPHYIKFDEDQNIVKILNLSTIIQNACYDAIKSTKNKIRYNNTFSMDIVPESEQIHNREIIQSEERVDQIKKIEKIKTLISEEDFRIFELAAEGYIQEEIAEIMGIPRGSISRRISRSRRLINKTL